MNQYFQLVKKQYKSFFYPPKDKKFHYIFMDNFRTVIFALVVALFIRTFFYEPFKIPSTSMVPTLRIGDFLFISKFDYGTKIPFTDAVINKKPIQVGDIIVFDKDMHNRGKTTTYIKRVAAVGGDTIEFRNNRIILNGKEQNQTPNGTLTYQDKTFEKTVNLYNESLGNVKIQVLDDPEVQIPNVEPYKVPEGNVIVMGDNRDNSFDSRLWRYPNWGLIKETEIRGKARFIFFSWDRNFKPRINRMFTSLVPQKSN